MSDTQVGRPSGDALELPESLQRLQERFLAVGLKAEPRPGFEDDEVNLYVEYPEGRGSRGILYDEGDVEPLDGIDLASVRFLPDYLATVDTSTGDVEAQVRTRTTMSLRRIPGFEELETRDDPEEEPSEDAPFIRMATNWRLAVEEDGVRMELSPASERYRAVRGIPPRSVPTTLKVSGLSHTSSEDTAKTLQTLSDAFFFDLDVRYGAIVELVAARGRLAPVRLRSGSTSRPAEFPKNRYLAQPAALYRYGRSAQGLPLLSFLAFYQVLEYFFPIFTQDEVMKRVQQTLRNPLFDPSDEVSVLRLIDAVRPTLRFGVPEKEQLRATVRRCLDADTVKEFVTSTERTREHFCKKSQSVQGLLPLRPDTSTPDIRDQVADRIYDIRCRIVHTKSDGGDSGVELLLPTGPEARSLGPDIELVRLAAQEALIAGAAPLHLK